MHVSLLKFRESCSAHVPLSAHNMKMLCQLFQHSFEFEEVLVQGGFETCPLADQTASLPQLFGSKESFILEVERK